MNKPTSLNFLQGDAEPIPPGSSATPNPADRLPQAVADRLIQLDGVVGVWIERDAQGQRFVALHYSKPGHPSHLPTTVEGLPVHIVGGAPINAGG